MILTARPAWVPARCQLDVREVADTVAHRGHEYRLCAAHLAAWRLAEQAGAASLERFAAKMSEAIAAYVRGNPIPSRRLTKEEQ